MLIIDEQSRAVLSIASSIDKRQRIVIYSSWSFVRRVAAVADNSEASRRWLFIVLSIGIPREPIIRG